MNSKEALDELEWFINCVYDSVEDGHAAYLKDEVESASNAYNKIEKDLEILEILKKYLYYDNKNHFIKMKQIRKSTFNFDYEDLKEWLENEDR